MATSSSPSAMGGGGGGGVGNLGSPGGAETFWSETRTEDGSGLYRGTLRDAKEGTLGVDIASGWKEEDAKKARQSCDAQTEPVFLETRDAQSTHRTSRATATDPTLSQGGVADPTSVDRDQDQNQEPPELQDNVVPFLESVVPLMEQELRSNAESTAFSFRTHVIDDRNTTVDLQHVLEPKLPTRASVSSTTSTSGSKAKDGEEARNPHKLVCTQLSWNATGYAVAASYGRFDVSGWCDLPGALVVWNLGSKSRTKDNGKDVPKDNGKKKAVAKSKKTSSAGDGTKQQIGSSLAPLKPDVVIETDMCLQCCACHPAHPALVAAGSYSGEVYVWNISSSDTFASDSEIARSRITSQSHHDPVMSVQWRYSLSEDLKSRRQASGSRKMEEAYQLVSLGMDGKVLVWQWSQAKGGTMEHPLYGYELVYSNPKTHKMITWGGTCMSFQRQPGKATTTTKAQKQQQPGGSSSATMDSSTFVVGAEGGGVFRCLLDEQVGSGTGMGSERDHKYRSPIKADFVQHAGMTSAVASSPFHRRLFVTCGSDSTVKVFNLLDRKPILQLEPTAVSLFSLCWSPVRPMVLAAGSGDGRVFFYDLAASKVHPIKVLHVHHLSLLSAGSSGLGSGDLGSATNNSKEGANHSKTQARHKPVYSLEFNPKLHTYFATTYGDSIRIWELGPQLMESPPGELQQVESLVSLGEDYT